MRLILAACCDCDPCLTNTFKQEIHQFTGQLAARSAKFGNTGAGAGKSLKKAYSKYG